MAFGSAERVFNQRYKIFFSVFSGHSSAHIQFVQVANCAVITRNDELWSCRTNRIVQRSQGSQPVVRKDSYSRARPERGMSRQWAQCKNIAPQFRKSYREPGWQRPAVSCRQQNARTFYHAALQIVRTLRHSQIPTLYLTAIRRLLSSLSPRG